MIEVFLVEHGDYRRVRKLDEHDKPRAGEFCCSDCGVVYEDRFRRSNTTTQCLACHGLVGYFPKKGIWNQFEWMQERGMVEGQL